MPQPTEINLLSANLYEEQLQRYKAGAKWIKGVFAILDVLLSDQLQWMNR